MKCAFTQSTCSRTFPHPRKRGTSTDKDPARGDHDHPRYSGRPAPRRSLRRVHGNPRLAERTTWHDPYGVGPGLNDVRAPDQRHRQPSGSGSAAALRRRAKDVRRGCPVGLSCSSCPGRLRCAFYAFTVQPAALAGGALFGDLRRNPDLARLTVRLLPLPLNDQRRSGSSATHHLFCVFLPLRGMFTSRNRASLHSCRSPGPRQPPAKCRRDVAVSLSMRDPERLGSAAHRRYGAMSSSAV